MANFVEQYSVLQKLIEYFCSVLEKYDARMDKAGPYLEKYSCSEVDIESAVQARKLIAAFHEDQAIILRIAEYTPNTEIKLQLKSLMPIGVVEELSLLDWPGEEESDFIDVGDELIHIGLFSATNGLSVNEACEAVITLEDEFYCVLRKKNEGSYYVAHCQICDGVFSYRCFPIPASD